MLRYLPFLMLIVPFTEIAVFILVGGWIGVLPTIALVILTAVLGATLLRHQGLGLAMKIRSEMEAGRAPGRDLANGAMMLVAGVLLLTPGFVTDSVGFLLFIPKIRTRLFEFLAKRIKFVTPNEGFQRPSYDQGSSSGTIDLSAEDYVRDENPNEDPVAKNSGGKNSDSPWNTKH